MNDKLVSVILVVIFAITVFYTACKSDGYHPSLPKCSDYKERCKSGCELYTVLPLTQEQEKKQRECVIECLENTGCRTGDDEDEDSDDKKDR